MAPRDVPLLVCWQAPFIPRQETRNPPSNSYEIQVVCVSDVGVKDSTRTRNQEGPTPGIGIQDELIYIMK